MAWTGPDELVAQVQRLWDQGRLLACAVPVNAAERATCDAPLEFPLPLRLRRPSPRELGERFEAVRAWIEALEVGSRAKQGIGYEIVWNETRNRQIGRNKTPVGIYLPRRADALALVGKT